MTSSRKLTLFIVACLVAACGALFSAPAQAQVVVWKQFNGIVVPENTVGEGQYQVIGYDQPWSTNTDVSWGLRGFGRSPRWGQGGSAAVNMVKGTIWFAVRGLVQAGGDDVGTPGSVMEVKGTLVCDTHGPDSTLFDTPLVRLTPTGDAFFFGNVGSFPSACENNPHDVAFLIRTPEGRWIASGSVRVVIPGKDNDNQNNI
jgi:hypothetical protein